MNELSLPQSSTLRFRREVTDRFGVLPNFFCSADAAPGLIEELWKIAKSAYLDSPLPSLFKERLFVYLSRFCEVRYCLVRHVGFLIGQGRPAGDAAAGVEPVEQVIEMLLRPVPQGVGLTTVTAIHQRDYPVVQCAVLVSAVLVLSINWAVDLLYHYLDPRVHAVE